ncbi:carbohydrate kinase family protein [Methanosarcina sp. T3]|uniref:carbohydrate kinase family protein n=1 Tax=Methanosarcina sp. T3 TaxID=3439062 RepID=UPI003F84D145
MGCFLFRNPCPEVGRKQEDTAKAVFGNKGRKFFLRCKPEGRVLQKERIFSSLENCTILWLNEEKAAAIFSMFSGIAHSCRTLCRLLTESYPRISVNCITKGPRGAAVYHGGVYEEIETTPVEVSDTVGAGDTFSAGFLYTYLSGYGVSKAASIACVIGKNEA